MTNKEILKFINDNPGDILFDFYNKTYEKLKDLNRKIDKLTLYLIILVFIYFIASKANISSFSIGPISISDTSLLIKLIPVLFAYLLFDLIITSGHKAELVKTVKYIFLSLYKQDSELKDLEEGRLNLYSRIVLPFSYSAEIAKFSTKKVSVFSGCFGAILVIPLFSLLFLPFYFEYYMLKEIYINQYFTTVGKISFFISIWIILMIIYYYLNTSIIAFKNKKNGEF